MTTRIDKLKRMLDAEPNDTFCLYGLAQEHIKAGDDAAAIELFDRLLHIEPAHCYAYFHRARSQQRLGDAAGARATLKAGLARARAHGDPKAAGEIEGFLNELES